MITIKNTSEKDLTELTHLMKACFPTNSHITDEAIKWAFFHPRFNGHLISCIAVDNDTAASHYGNQWHPTQRSGMHIPSYLCLDMVTAPGYRGRGLVSQLAKQVYASIDSKKAAYTIGFSNKYGIQVDRNANAYGYSIVGQFDHYYAIPLWGSRINLQPMKTITTPPTPPQDYFSIEKSLSYLQWRYIEKPYHPYLMYRFTSKHHEGMVILKINRRFVDVLDILLSDYSVENLTTAFNAARAAAGMHRRMGVTLKALQNPLITQALKNSGYFSLPQQFQSQPYWLTIKLHNNKYQSTLLPQSWWLLGGDIL